MLTDDRPVCFDLAQLIYEPALIIVATRTGKRASPLKSARLGRGLNRGRAAAHDPTA